MLCQKCMKNIATVRYAEVVEGKVADLHLCPECLAKHQTSTATGFELSGSAPSPKRPTTPPETSDILAVAQKHCRNCGADLKEVLKTGKVGCGQCYANFPELLEPLLRSFHTSLRHRGKMPRVSDSRAAARGELQTKRALLRSALKTENYEQAATLRDEIRKLELELGLALSRRD